MKHVIEYHERFENRLPSAMYPLPIRGDLALIQEPAWWSEFLDFVDDFVQRFPHGGDVPARLQRTPKNPVLEAIHAKCVVFMHFSLYDDLGDSFQKRQLDQLKHVAELARARDYALFMVEFYSEAFTRCANLCAMDLPDDLCTIYDEHAFTRKSVKARMDDVERWSGPVNYRHIRKILLSMAIDSSPFNAERRKRKLL